MELNDKDWQMLIDIGTREYGEDVAMDGIVKLLEALERGPIENPVAWLRTTCGHRERDLREKGEGFTEIQMSIIKDQEEQGHGIPPALWDTRDPYEIIAAREELEIIERDYPELLEEVFNQEESIYDRVPDGMKKSLFYERKGQAWKESKERRAV